MKPSLYTFVLGLALGVGLSSWFWTYKADQERTESEAALEQSEREASRFEAMWRECAAR